MYHRLNMELLWTVHKKIFTFHWKCTFLYCPITYTREIFIIRILYKEQSPLWVSCCISDFHHKCCCYHASKNDSEAACIAGGIVFCVWGWKTYLLHLNKGSCSLCATCFNLPFPELSLLLLGLVSPLAFFLTKLTFWIHWQSILIFLTPSHPCSFSVNYWSFWHFLSH